MIHLEHWIDQEQPPPELRQVVVDWTFALFDNPYAAGLRRDKDQPNFYYLSIPPRRLAGWTESTIY